MKMYTPEWVDGLVVFDPTTHSPFRQDDDDYLAIEDSKGQVWQTGTLGNGTKCKAPSPFRPWY